MGSILGLRQCLMDQLVQAAAQERQGHTCRMEAKGGEWGERREDGEIRKQAQHSRGAGSGRSRGTRAQA